MMRTDSLADDIAAHQEVMLAERTRKIRAGLHEILDSIRLVSRNMYPVTLSPGGLCDALKSLAGDVCAMSGIACTVHSPGDIGLPDSIKSTQIFYIVREAVNNAIRHSGADGIVIELYHDDAMFCVTVRDNGRGIDPPHRVRVSV